MKKNLFVFLLILLSVQIWAQIKYPITRTEIFDTTIFNTTLTDPYSWLSRNQHETEMLTWAH